MDNFNRILIQEFYNTISLSESQWQDENKKALSLQNTVENLFSSNPTAFLSPWQVKDFLQAKMGKKVNINSVRRSMTNLKNIDRLIKTNKMRLGNEGKNEHQYVLYSPEMLTHSTQDGIYKKGQKSAAQVAGEIIAHSKPVLIFEN